MLAYPVATTHTAAMRMALSLRSMSQVRQHRRQRNTPVQTLYQVLRTRRPSVAQLAVLFELYGRHSFTITDAVEAVTAPFLAEYSWIELAYDTSQAAFVSEAATFAAEHKGKDSLFYLYVRARASGSSDAQARQRVRACTK